MVAAACATARPRAAFSAAARPARRSVRVQASGAVALPDSITKVARPAVAAAAAVVAAASGTPETGGSAALLGRRAHAAPLHPPRR